MRLAVRLGLAVVILVGALVVITGGRDGSLEVMAVLLLVGLLVARALASDLASRDLLGRYDVFLWSGLGLFVVIIVRRIRDILGL